MSVKLPLFQSFWYTSTHHYLFQWYKMCKIRLLWFLCVLDRPNTYKFLIIPIKAIHNGKEKLGKTRENARPTQLVNPGEETDE